MRGFEYYWWRIPSVIRFLPTRHTQAPPVSGLQSWEAELRRRRRQVVTPPPSEFEKLICNDGAYRVATDVTGLSSAVAVAIESRHRRATTLHEWCTQDIFYINCSSFIVHLGPFGRFFTLLSVTGECRYQKHTGRKQPCAMHPHICTFTHSHTS